MLRNLPFLVLVAVALAGCNREPGSADAGRVAPTPSIAGEPAQQASPATPPAASADRFDGYGDLRFGMTADEARKAWGGELRGEPAEANGCYHLTPGWAKAPADFSLMIEADRFVRYDVGNAREVAPGGGKVGMSADRIRSLYSGRVREQPHKYVPGGQTLRIGADDDSGSVLVFEADASGKVTAWRVGQPPAVDYVEGCS